MPTSPAKETSKNRSQLLCDDMAPLGAAILGLGVVLLEQCLDTQGAVSASDANIYLRYKCIHQPLLRANLLVRGKLGPPRTKMHLRQRRGNVKVQCRVSLIHRTPFFQRRFSLRFCGGATNVKRSEQFREERLQQTPHKHGVSRLCNAVRPTPSAQSLWRHDDSSVGLGKFRTPNPMLACSGRNQAPRACCCARLNVSLRTCRSAPDSFASSKTACFPSFRELTTRSPLRARTTNRPTRGGGGGGGKPSQVAGAIEGCGLSGGEREGGRGTRERGG